MRKWPAQPVSALLSLDLVREPREFPRLMTKPPLLSLSIISPRAKFFLLHFQSRSRETAQDALFERNFERAIKLCLIYFSRGERYLLRKLQRRRNSNVQPKRENRSDILSEAALLVW